MRVGRNLYRCVVYIKIYQPRQTYIYPYPYQHYYTDE